MRGPIPTRILMLGTFTFALHNRYRPRPVAQEQYRHEDSAEAEQDDAFRYHDSSWVRSEDRHPAIESHVD